MTAHTPGPWRTDGRDIHGPDGLILATADIPASRDVEEARANARLMAAAPDLDSTLRGVRSMAQMHARAGSTAWTKAVVLIDDVLARVAP